MQWDDTLYAGFSDAIPWIKVNSDHNAINVATNEKNKDSILSYYKEIISLRKKYPIIVYGDYEDIDFNNKRMYAYKRTIDNESLYVFCNFSAKPLKYDLTGMKGFECLLSNYKEYGDMLLLRPYESRVYYKKA